MEFTNPPLRTFLAISCLWYGAANAAIITVDSYDAHNVALSDTGYWYWYHTYDGAITYNGSTYDYMGGSGTLNDGAIGTSPDDTELFQTTDNSSITLYLAENSVLNTLSLYSFGPTPNGIPGNITGLDITINGMTQYFATTGFGPSNAAYPNNGRDHSHELVDLSGSALAGLVTSTVTLSGFTTEKPYAEYFSISEIVVDGSTRSVPEPSTLALMGLGMIGFGLARRKKQ